MASKRRISYRLAVFSVPLIAFVGIATPALATVTSSTACNSTPFGFCTHETAGIYTTNKNVGRAYIDTNPSATKPAGWMGAQPSLYKGGAVCSGTSMTYTNGPAVGFSVPTYGYCGSGVYNSKGSVAAWNGSGYNNYYTPVTPNFNG